MALTDRGFRHLLRKLPSEFGADYSREMEATFRAERHQASGAMALARVWMATIADVFRTADRLLLIRCASVAEDIARLARSDGRMVRDPRGRWEGRRERVPGARVTWEFFRTLGVRPALGRDFDPGEDHPARRRVTLVSDELWRPGLAQIHL